jgi:tripartite-type tricarboxylate transporter receptor subunit TctC
MDIRRALYLAAVILAAVSAGRARAETAAEFYRSHPLTIVLGYSAGGGFDIYVRDLQRFLGKYIAGNPTIVVQNMPGAGSLTAANYIYNRAPRDGTMVGMSRAPVMDPLTGTSATAFDATKFTWIGNGMHELTVCAVLGAPQIKTMQDGAKYPFTLAGSGPGSDDDMFSKLMMQMFHWKAKLVSGYPGGNEMTQAVDTGEVDGRCGWSFSSMMIARPQWVTEKKIRFLTALTVERSKFLPDVPALLEFAKSDREKQLMKLFITAETLGRPFMAPPGMPADRTEALRTGFQKAFADPGFIASRTASHEEVNPMSGAQMQKTIEELYATPKDLIEEGRAIVAEKEK